MTIYVCSNAETICDGYTDERTHAWQDEIASAATDAAYRILIESGIDPADVTCESNFRSWHGGKCSHQQKMYGLTGGYVVYPADAEPLVKAACEKADDAFGKARDEAVEQFESDD